MPQYTILFFFFFFFSVCGYNNATLLHMQYIRSVIVFKDRIFFLFCCCFSRIISNKFVFHEQFLLFLLSYCMISLFCCCCCSCCLWEITINININLMFCLIFFCLYNKFVVLLYVCTHTYVNVYMYSLKQRAYDATSYLIHTCNLLCCNTADTTLLYRCALVNDVRSVRRGDDCGMNAVYT